jgi:hypothetical protein
MFKMSSFPDINKFDALQMAKDDIAAFFANRKSYEIGEPFLITDVFSALKNSAAVLDVLEVDVDILTGGAYSDSNFDIIRSRSGDGRKIFCPEDSCFEIKWPNSDIIGTVV